MREAIDEAFNDVRQRELTTLDLSDIALTDMGAALAAATLSTVPTITRVNLSYNKFGPRGMEVLIPASPKGLTGLILADNKLGAEGVAAIQGLGDLRELDLRNCGIVGAEGARALVRVLAGCPLLETLRLDKNKLGPDGAAILAEALPSLSHLRQLNLAVNELGEGISALASVIHCCPELTEFNVAANGIDDVGAKSLIDATRLLKPGTINARHNPITVDLYRNSLAMDTAEELEEVVPCWVKKVCTGACNSRLATVYGRRLTNTPPDIEDSPVGWAL
jgi:Ran GTPase-activating protein (RanGAP) involved in mRNA processing and transport